jgi:hypothetical protein
MNNKIEELQKEIEVEKTERAKKVLEEINTILKDNNCELKVQLIWNEDNGPIFNKLIVAN